MGKVNTEAEIVQWATTIVEGKGEKYIALSKGDQFAIAKYILAHQPSVAVGIADNESGSITTVRRDGDEVYVGDPPNDLSRENPDICTTSGSHEEGTYSMSEDEEDAEPKEKRTMLEALIARGFRTPQDAFDEFLKDTNGKDKERRVSVARTELQIRMRSE